MEVQTEKTVVSVANTDFLDVLNIKFSKRKDKNLDKQLKNLLRLWRVSQSNYNKCKSGKNGDINY